MSQENQPVAPAWEPLYDKIVVKRDPAIEQIGSIAVADAYKRNQNTGTVLRTGNGRWINGVLYPLTLEVGHRVIFSKFAGVELEDSGQDVIVLREDEVLAYLKS